MVLFHHLMQGSVLLPHRVSHQSLAVLQSAKSLTPELVGAFHVRPLPTQLSCRIEGNIDRRDYRGIVGADPVDEFRSCRRVGAQGLSSADEKGISRMPGSSFASFSRCSFSNSLGPSRFHRSVAIHGQSLDYSAWKCLVSGPPGPFRHNPAQPWYCIPSRALRGLKTTHYGSIAGKRAGQDLSIRDRDNCCDRKSDNYGSEKGWISAGSRPGESRGDVKDKKEKDADEPVTVFHRDSVSESQDEEKTSKKHKKEKKLKRMQEEEEDSESDSDGDEEMQKMKKRMSKGKVEVVRISEDDSESDSDEEKEMRKKMKADKKELKKQAKQEEKEMKALKTVECEDSDSEDDKKEKKQKKKKHKEQEKVLAVSEDEDQISHYDYLDEPDSGSGSDRDGEGDDVEVVPSAMGECEEEDFELVGNEDLSDEIEGEIEDALEDYEDEDLDDDFWEEEEGEARVGDGGDGGGVVLGESPWEKKAFDLAEVVVKELGTDFAIYAFKASPDGLVRVRVDKLSDQYGSPTMSEIETFSRKYSEILDSSELIPDSVAVEVSSPGAERIVKIPDELERFKQLPMYVQYIEDESANGEKDGVLELDSIDSGSGMTIWKIANVKFNREQSGKGRPLNSKQRKWRAHVPFNSLKLVRLYLDV